MRNHLVKLIYNTSLLFSLLCACSSNAETLLPNVSSHQSVGTVNCASSTCHGSVTPWENAHILQNEYTTWVGLDKHAKAYSVLMNAQSQRIAKNLGLKQPAYQSKICLDCHTHNPSKNLQGERYVASEGVGCEACHGSAEKWISSHMATGTTHEDNVRNGMYPIERPLEQTKLCLSCHFGDENRFVTHRIMGAGHPRLSFEVETFAATQPAHYKIDANWMKRKGEFSTIKMWVIGQAVASKQLLDTLADHKRGRDGLFPELVLFDCHACHHPMSEQKYVPRLGVGPGRVRLNDSNLLMLRAIYAVVDPANAVAFNTQVSQLHHAIAGSAEMPGNAALEVTALAKKLSSTIDQFIIRLEKKHFNANVLRDILNALMNETSVSNYTDYAGAEQAYMSIASLTSSLNKMNGLKNIASINRRLSALRNTLANQEKYKPEEFRSALSDLRSVLLVEAK